jgi:hypothetical protein
LIIGLLTWVGMGHADVRAQQRGDSPDSTVVSSAVPGRIVDRVASSFADGDAEQLLGETSERIEVGLPGTRAYYSRSQAVYVLREFFDDHDPTRFEVEDVSKAGASYFVTGRFWHSRSEQPMHVYTRFATRGSNHLHEIRVEPIR